MPFDLGYNTNGFAHHRLADAINVLAEIGYESVAITLDYGALNPFDDDILEQTASIVELLQTRNMSCVVETGARFLLDSRQKHWPTLLTPDPEQRQRRLDFLDRSMEIAARLNAEAVSFWSGARDSAMSEKDCWTLLVDMCDELLTKAVQHDVWLAFEPEPDMFVDRLSQFQRLADELSHPRFGLTLDVGHVHCLEDGTPSDRIREFGKKLLNIHIEDMKTGIHDHLMFGEGEMAFDPIFEALRDVQYTGTVNVELSRHSHDAVRTAERAFEFLSKLNG